MSIESPKVTYLVQIRLKDTDYRGFDAIGQCRRLELPETTVMTISKSVNSLVCTNCTEEFARLWFSGNSYSSSDLVWAELARIDLNDLKSGEVVCYGNGNYMINPALSPERILELFQQAETK